MRSCPNAKKRAVPTQNSANFRACKRSETPTGAEEEPAKKSLAQTAGEVREKIASDDFAGALEIWKNSGYSEKNPSLERDILEDIGTRADSLMRRAENLLTVGTPQTRADAAKLLCPPRGLPSTFPTFPSAKRAKQNGRL